MEKVPIGVLASGRGSNLQAILRAAAGPAYPARVAVVLSDAAEAPALDHARVAGADAVHVPPGRKGARLSPEAERRMVEELRARNVRLVALAGFMRILSGDFLAYFPRAVLNIHPSLLPAFPGLDVQRKALEHGVRFSGCTVHFVDEGIDSGPILLQAAVPVEDRDTPETLAERILEEEHRIYPEAIRMVLEGGIRVEGRRVLRAKKEGGA
ncbi:MAG: phosphoribosylglycinamide formyltransferase [Candidatus Eisenbacteria bacterium]|nr:phosphoribosylglycinamide formyltransferase [Candidatus Eisenbacteria bacterium]